ncbi:MAG: sensor histidine kinase [Dermatophilaceae bacterium]|nr:sensor histidine kinase [Dermatophilaceae bacterium]
MLVEAAPGGLSVRTPVVGAAFVVWTAVGYRWALVRARAASVAYLASALVLGFVTFDLAGPGVGSTVLLVLVVVQAVLLLPVGWALGVAAMVPLVHVGMPMADGLRQVLSTGLACAVAFVLARLWLREQQAHEQLAVANDRLRELTAQTEELAAMRERTRMARDIHDGLGHHLTVVGMQVQAARAVLSADPVRADGLLAQAEDQVRQALTSVRDSVGALRGHRAVRLPDQLRALAGESAAAGLPTSVAVDGKERSLADEVQSALYRMAQEGLTNVRKHAHAHAAALRLAYLPDRMTLEVRDDGCGIREDAAGSEGFGLTGIRERAEHLGGSVVVDSSPGAGLAVRVELPG